MTWIETHFDLRESTEFSSIAREYGYKCFSITRLMRRFDDGSGGVTIMVEENLKCREVRRS